MADESTESPRSKPDQHPRKHGLARRRLLKSLAAGGVVAGAHVVPDRWVKPVVDHVVVPAHAQGSGPSMTAFITFGAPLSTQVSASGTVDGATSTTDGPGILVDGQATLINPPVPGQNVTLNLEFVDGTSNADFSGAGFPSTVASNAGTGVATFADATILVEDFSDSTDLGAATLTATFTSAGVPPVVITVDFA